jgi:hypothetical protein
MSCCDDNIYESSCCPDTPYPTVQHESVPSLIDNLVNALYGEITKTVADGRVVWDIPCDPTQSPAEVPTIPRDQGEGLLCYLMRVFQNTVGQYSPFQYWSYAGTGSQNTFALSPSTNTLRSSYLVYLNGVVQPPTAYTISNTVPVNIVFSVVPANGTAITIVNLGYQPPGVIQDVTQSDATPTGSSQTQTVGGWLAYILQQLANLGNFRELPPYPTTAGQKMLIAPGSGGNPFWGNFPTELPAYVSGPNQKVLVAPPITGTPLSWQDLPALSIGPIVATGSTTPRFVSDRFAEVFCVEDYGAVGDWNGTTGTDDAPAIQACINAAIAYTNARGGEARVVFTPGKSYRLVTRQLNTIGQTSVSNHLNIYNGNTQMKLCIDGRGARLYGNGTNPASAAGSNGTDILYVCSRFDTIRIENLYFEQQPHLVIYGGAPSGGIRMSPFTTTVTYSKLFSIKGCQFENCRMPFIIFPFNNFLFVDKLENLEIIDTQMLHNRGSAHCMGSIGGNQTVNLSRWIKNFYCENVYFSGMPENNVLPFDVDAPVDGFSYVGATHENYSNCFFTGNPIETIIPSGAGSIFNGINFGPFVQPAIGSTVSVPVTANAFGNALTLGKVYMMDMGGPAPSNPSFNQVDIGPVGVYIPESFTGAYAGAFPGTVTFRRYAMSKAEIWPYAQDVATGLTVNDAGYGIRVFEADTAAQRSLVVSGCRFVYEKSMLGYPYNVTGNAATNTFTASGPLGGTCTISQASPAVITKNNHGLLEGSRVYFTTTGSLPSGIVASTIYIVRDVTQNTFTLSPIGSLGTRVNTTTAGSGIHTMNTAPLVPANTKVRFNVTGGNLVAGKTYYVINWNQTSPTFQVSESFNGPVFDLTSNVTSGTVQVFWRGGDPCIAGYCPGTITGNVFYGYAVGMFFKDQYNWGPTRGATITGNYFVNYSDEPDQTGSGFTVAQFGTNSCNFSNNTIQISKSQDTVYPLFITGDNHVITGNTCVCLNQANVPVSTRFINWNNGAPASGWRCIVENNVVFGLDNYGNAGSAPQVMGPYMGQLRGTIASAGSQEIKIRQRHISSDKAQWLLGIEDDGEITVEKYGGYAP